MPKEEVENVEIVEQLPGGEEGDDKLFKEGIDTDVKEEVKLDKKEKEVKEEEEEVKEEVKEELKEEEIKEEESEKDVKPSWAKVSEKYPNFFKEFPEIRDALGRDKTYGELFPEGVEQARETIENHRDFQFFESKVIDGDAKSFLEVIKETGKADLGNFVSNFLPALKEVNNDLY